MNKTKPRLLSLLLVFSLLVGMVGFFSADTSYAAARKIHVKKKNITLIAGDIYWQTLIGKNGKKIKSTKIKWKSSKKSVATIDLGGCINAKKAGTVKMTAKYRGKKYKFTVKVKKPSYYGTNIKPKLTKVELNDLGSNLYIHLKCTKVRDAASYELYMSKNGGKYKLFESTPTNRFLLQKAKRGCTYSFKVRAVSGKYKTSFSNTKSIIIHKDGTYEVSDNTIKSSANSASDVAKKIYNYVYNNGYSVNSDYCIPGNRCVESSYYYGPDYTDIYVISIDTKDSSTIYFGSYRIKPAPGKYKDTTESTVLTYNINSSVGEVSVFQFYYTSDKYSSFAHYTTNGLIHYAKYLGTPYYQNEKGISNITIGDNNTPVEVGSYESRELIERVQTMISGVDRLMSQLINIRFRNIGFSQL